jgi:membrane protein DedA with SNARE-associated domain
MFGSHGPFVAVIAALIIAGLGVPLPEDLSLVTGGYLAWRGDERLWLVILLCFVAIVAGDSALWLLGRRYGENITQHKHLRHRLTPARLERVEGYFKRHGAKTIIVARFLAGARALFFVAAGAMKMPYWRFLLFDGLAALISGTIWVLIGRRFGANIQWVRGVIHRVEHWLGLAVVLSLLAWGITKLLRRRVAGPPTET